jgi:hypothetical protein
MIKNLYYPCKVPVIVANILIKTYIFSTYFQNTFKYQISWKSVQWESICSMRTDGQTDMTKLIVVFAIL